MKKRGKRRAKPDFRVTDCYIKKTCGLQVFAQDISVPEGYIDWVDYLYAQRKPPYPYKSWLEFRLFTWGDLKHVPYEPEKLPYQEIKDREYNPDGVYKDALIEVKGRFRRREEMDKYLAIRKCYPDRPILFVLHVPNVPLPGTQPRKDGSKMTQEEWLTKHSFDYTYEGEAAAYMKEMFNE